ncbi:MAG: hypothetical protein IJO45_01475 [Oscillospiraceae bacterium]|nr:hypothetical protein [Oscillospiraceae bacterium]
MKTIMLSKDLIDAYKNSKKDISYALSELLGYVDYNNSRQITCPPIIQRDSIAFLIDDAVFSELQDKFDDLNSYGEVAELLLWSNYFLGGSL